MINYFYGGSHLR